MLGNKVDKLEAKKEELKRFRAGLKRFAHDFPKLAEKHSRCIEELDFAAELSECAIRQELLNAKG